MKLTQSPNSSTNLILRTATQKAEIDLLRETLNDEQYLKAGRPASLTLWQGIYENNEEDGTSTLVCVLCWGAAAKHLKSRENFIQRDKVTCANRLKLVVQLRRFLIIDVNRRPNFASQCIGISLRSLQTEWEKAHDYRPLLAESFHDPKQHTGTLYKATNWTPLGLTKGLRQTQSRLLSRAQITQTTLGHNTSKNSLTLLSHPSELPKVHQKAVASATTGARAHSNVQSSEPTPVSARGPCQGVQSPYNQR